MIQAQENEVDKARNGLCTKILVFPRLCVQVTLLHKKWWRSEESGALQLCVIPPRDFCVYWREATLARCLCSRKGIGVSQLESERYIFLRPLCTNFLLTNFLSKDYRKSQRRSVCESANACTTTNGTSAPSPLITSLVILELVEDKAYSNLMSVIGNYYYSIDIPYSKLPQLFVQNPPFLCNRHFLCKAAYTHELVASFT